MSATIAYTLKKFFLHNFFLKENDMFNLKHIIESNRDEKGSFAQDWENIGKDINTSINTLCEEEGLLVEKE